MVRPALEESGSDDELALPAKPDSLSDVVYETIRDAIVNRTLPPGFRVTEAELATRLNVSKTPVRESLLSLRKLGLIEPSGRRGWHIVVPSETLIQQAYETRQGLEMFAAELAAERSSEDARQRIVSHAQRCLSAAEVGDLAGFRTWDMAFHEAVADAAGNPRLAELIRDAFVLVMTLRRRDVPHAAASVDCARAHVQIGEAIANQDPDRARQAMRAHVRQVEGYVLAHLAEESE